MATVQSNHLNQVHYNPDTRIMLIQFVNGSVYRYADVPPTEHDNLMQSSSPGAYFHDKIKGRYGDKQIIQANNKNRLRGRNIPVGVRR